MNVFQEIENTSNMPLEYYLPKGLISFIVKSSMIYELYQYMKVMAIDTNIHSYIFQKLYDTFYHTQEVISLSNKALLRTYISTRTKCNRMLFYMLYKCLIQMMWTHHIPHCQTAKELKLYKNDTWTWTSNSHTLILSFWGRAHPLRKTKSLTWDSKQAGC